MERVQNCVVTIRRIFGGVYNKSVQSYIEGRAGVTWPVVVDCVRHALAE